MSLRCDVCSVSFISEGESQEHKGLHSRVGRSLAEHACACGTTFETDAELYAHAMETHRP